MNAWLYDILRDGRLKDNQTYIAEDGVIRNNVRMGLIELERRGYRQRGGPHNNEEAIWRFLTESNKEIATCLKTHTKESVVLFNAGEYEHNTEDEFIQLHGTDVCNFRLTTGNLIGCVKRGDYSLKISSRFGDAFLRYIIADADGFLELEDFGGEELNGDYEWLLAYLWMIKLKRAFRLGLPKAYAGKTEATSRVRGQLDPVRYSMDGERGAYLCCYREHSYSNPQAVLISEAYRRLKPHSLLRGAYGGHWGPPSQPARTPCNPAFHQSVLLGLQWCHRTIQACATKRIDGLWQRLGNECLLFRRIDAV